MDNNIKRFTCFAEEWYFVRVFMRVEKGSGLMDKALENQKRKGFTPIKLFLIAVISIILNGVLQALPEFKAKFIISIILVGLIFFGLIGAVVTLKQAGSYFKKFKESLTVKPKNGEEVVTLYEITEEGLYINYFNQENQNQMFFIRWKNVERIELGEMKYMYTISDSDSMKAERFKANIKREFNKAKMELGYFPYEPQLAYEDVQAIFLFMDNQRYAEIPIPPSWKVNGVFDNFLKEVRNRILKKW